MIPIGCVADDYTGATDLAGALVRSGLRVVQTFETPPDSLALDECDAVVIALKTRSAPVDDAIAESLSAVRRLREYGCVRFLFKYCSTFDSTAEGNIGPVVESLMDELDQRQTVLCPAFPTNGRTQYLGHLFVGLNLLSNSSMRNHPLTPMTNSNLLDVLSAQALRPTGLVPYNVVEQGAEAIRECMSSLASERDSRLLLTDALEDLHLDSIAEACWDMPLVTGGSAIGGAMPAAWRRNGVLYGREHAPLFPVRDGPALLLAGSCSEASLQQIRAYASDNPARKLDLLRFTSADDREAEDQMVTETDAWVREHLESSPLVYVSAEVKELEQVQARLGSRGAAELAERLMSRLAALSRDAGVKQFVVAGGETSGSVVRALGVQAIRVGPEICPGVPWCESVGAAAISLALKSGNFGQPDFFASALSQLQ